MYKYIDLEVKGPVKKLARISECVKLEIVVFVASGLFHVGVGVWGADRSYDLR